MAEITIRDALWQGLVSAAAKRGKRPETLAAIAVREFLNRLSDEELLAKSDRAARRQPFKIADTEELIGQHRRHRKARNGL